MTAPMSTETKTKRMARAAEIDRQYRLRNGTTKADWEANRLRGVTRPGPGRAGVVLWVRVDDADRLYGAGDQEEPSRE